MKPVLEGADLNLLSWSTQYVLWDERLFLIADWHISHFLVYSLVSSIMLDQYTHSLALSRVFSSPKWPMCSLSRILASGMLESLVCGLRRLIHILPIANPCNSRMGGCFSEQSFLHLAIPGILGVLVDWVLGQSALPLSCSLVERLCSWNFWCDVMNCEWITVVFVDLGSNSMIWLRASAITLFLPFTYIISTSHFTSQSSDHWS